VYGGREKLHSDIIQFTAAVALGFLVQYQAATAKIATNTEQPITMPAISPPDRPFAATGATTGALVGTTIRETIIK